MTSRSSDLQGSHRTRSSRDFSGTDRRSRLPSADEWGRLTNKLAPDRISDQAWQSSFNVASQGSFWASYACVDTWLTDFRDDLPKIDVPMLVMHGTEDRILPFDSTAARLPDLIDDVKVVPVEGGPHNIGWTHPEVVNPALLAFLEGGLEAVNETQSKVATT